MYNMPVPKDHHAIRISGVKPTDKCDNKSPSLLPYFWPNCNNGIKLQMLRSPLETHSGSKD